MTQKEYSIIAAINTEGLDNSQWGMSDTERDTDFYGCTFNDKFEKTPPHIYIRGSNDETYSNAMHKLLFENYDRKYVNPYSEDEFICFFWLDPQTL